MRSARPKLRLGFTLYLSFQSVAHRGAVLAYGRMPSAGVGISPDTALSSLDCLRPGANTLPCGVRHGCRRTRSSSAWFYCGCKCSCAVCCSSRETACCQGRLVSESLFSSESKVPHECRMQLCPCSPSAEVQRLRAASACSASGRLCKPEHACLLDTLWQPAFGTQIYRVKGQHGTT